MSAYPPPSENLPIFDSALFGNNTDITIDNLKSKFLTYPLAQAGLETIPNLAITSSGTAPTAGATSNDTTIATTAFVKANALTPLSPSPAGTYTTPSSVIVNTYGQITSATSGNTYTLPSPAPTAGSYTAPSSVSVNSAGQITSISSGTAYALPSPAPTAGSYTNANITINSAGQITSASNGTANSYNPLYYDGVVANTNPYTIRWGIFNSSNAPSASAYQAYIYQVGGSQSLPYGELPQYYSLTTPTILGGQTAFTFATRENINFTYGGTPYSAWGYALGSSISYPEVNVSYYSTISTQSGSDWTLSFFMKFNNAFTPATGATFRLMLVPVI